MHVLVALPSKKLLHAISPLINALGERVIPIIDEKSGSQELNRLASLGAARKALQTDKEPAIFVTVNPSPEVIFDALLAEFSDCRAMIIYEAAGTGLAHRLQAGDSVADAAQAWLGGAMQLLEFAKANRRNATLVCAEHVLSAPREFLKFCENRFLFDLVDCAAKPASFAQPDTMYRLVAAGAMEKTEALRSQDAQLSELALDLSIPPADDFSELDRFIRAFKQMQFAQNDRSRALAEADAMRQSAKLAETAARDAEQQIVVEAVNGPQLRVEAESGDGQDDMAKLREEHDHLLSLLSDTQAIAERSVADLAELRQRNIEAIATAQDDVSEDGEGQTLSAPASAIIPQSDGSSSFGQRVNNAISLRRRRQNRRDAELIAASDLFDAEWYLDRNSDLQVGGISPLQHFVRFGGQEGRAPGPKFSSRRYLADYPDVADGGYNPLVHYLRFGKDEGREVRVVE